MRIRVSQGTQFSYPCFVRAPLYLEFHFMSISIFVHLIFFIFIFLTTLALVNAVAFHPQNNLMVSVSDDFTMFLWGPPLRS